jgi:hypothetical protein
MDQTTFDREMNRIYEVFSDRAYAPERTKLIWSAVRNLAPQEFSAVVSDLIGSCATPPLVSRFREAVQQLYQKNSFECNRAKDQWIDSLPWCSLCGKKGEIVALKRDDGTLFAFRCPCEIGSRLWPRVPVWRQEHMEIYAPEFTGAAPPSLPLPPAPRTLKPVPDTAKLAANDRD